MERKHRLDEGQELIARNRARSHRRNVVRKTRLEIGQTFYLGLPTRVQHHFAGLTAQILISVNVDRHFSHKLKIDRYAELSLMPEAGQEPLDNGSGWSRD